MSLTRLLSITAVAAALLLAAATPPAHAGLSRGQKCAFTKQRVAVRMASSLLGCLRKALAAQAPVDPACTTAATDAFRSAFDKIEMRGGCEPAGDLDRIEFVVDRFVEGIGLQLQGVCSAPGSQCGGGAPPCCTGLVCSGAIGQTPTCHP